jgi:integrase
MNDNEAWAKVGELKLCKRVGKDDPTQITFDEVVKRYFETYPFRKQSTRELQQQVIQNLLLPVWGQHDVLDIGAKELKSWFLKLNVSNGTRGKYRGQMSHLFVWAISEEMIPKYVVSGDGVGLISANPCERVKGPQFSQESDYEALALELEDTLAVLSELKQPEYALSLLIATCGLRISEALGLRWKDILWESARVSIRQTFVHSTIQHGAKTKLSRSRVEVPQLALAVLGEWRKETPYSHDDDYVFPSLTLCGRQPRTASMIVQDYLKPAAIRAGVLVKRDGKLFSKEGDLVRRFGFHNLGRHSLASFLMDNAENPAVVQAILRHARMDMTLYYSHSSKKAKRAAVENYASHLSAEPVRVRNAGVTGTRENMSR